MVEIIEVKAVLGGSGPGAVGNIEVSSLEDLKKIAKIYKEPIIYKKDREYYLFHDRIVYRYGA